MDGSQETEGVRHVIGPGQRVSEYSQSNLDIAQGLMQQGKRVEALPYISKAVKDRRNIDAGIELAFVSPTVKDTLQILQQAEARGKKILLEEWLSPAAFDDDGGYVGNFWSISETRPYMRVLDALSRIYFETEQNVKCTDMQIEMLRLCTNDDLAVRKRLGSSLIRDNRFTDALFFSQAWLEMSESSKFNLYPRGGTVFLAPKEFVYPAEMEEKLTKSCDGAVIHCAALASFRLFGNSPQSQQYLRIAIKSNPYILLRVLGRSIPPGQYNRFPPVVDKSQEAQDYLFFAQDLWTDDQVWAWVYGNSLARHIILNNCSREGCPVREGDITQFKQCAACRLVSYCGPECQKPHWKSHKAACKAIQAIKVSRTTTIPEGKSLES